MPRRTLAADFNHCGAVELSVRFALWASALKQVPSAKRIEARFGCSRATAYRWRAAFCAATGQPTRQPGPRAPTADQKRRLARERIGYRRGEGEARCATCTAYRPGPTRGPWGRCLRHALPVRATAACDSHRASQAGTRPSPTSRLGRTPS